MTCRAAFAALRSLLVGSDTPASGQKLRLTKGDTYGPAPIAFPSQKPVGELLQVRAHRIHNRNASRAAVYLRRHLILSRGS